MLEEKILYHRKSVNPFAKDPFKLNLTRFNQIFIILLFFSFLNFHLRHNRKKRAESLRGRERAREVGDRNQIPGYRRRSCCRRGRVILCGLQGGIGLIGERREDMAIPFAKLTILVGAGFFLPFFLHLYFLSFNLGLSLCFIGSMICAFITKSLLIPPLFLPFLFHLEI